MTAVDVVGVGANSIDFVCRLPFYPEPYGPNSKLGIRSYDRSPGGQTATVLSACASLGLRTSYVGTVARDENGTLILDALRGDATLFTRQDEVEQQWRFVDRIARAWADGHGDLPTYPAGTWGPADADLLVARDGRSWRNA